MYVWTEGTSATVRSGCARVGHANGSTRTRAVVGVSTRQLATWSSRYFEDWQITLYHVVELLTPHGPVRDPYLLEFSERYDLDSGCSVEPTLLLHVAVVLAADTRPATVCFR